MSGIQVVWVGRRAPAGLEAAAAEYLKRISRHLPVTEARVRPATGRAGDAGRALGQEAAAVRKHLRLGDAVVVLDERGRERTTEELAGWLSERRLAGRTVFVIGSDLGVDPGLKSEADELFALSRLTLPHGLARLLLLEQLYRACDLLAGGRYHRGSSG